MVARSSAAGGASRSVASFLLYERRFPHLHYYPPDRELLTVEIMIGVEEWAELNQEGGILL